MPPHQEQSFAHEVLCGLLRIDLVTSIGRYTFDGCSSSSVAFLVQQFELCMSTHGLLVPRRTAIKLKLYPACDMLFDISHSPPTSRGTRPHMHNGQRMHCEALWFCLVSSIYGGPSPITVSS